jgi:hypothetical protein
MMRSAALAALLALTLAVSYGAPAAAQGGTPETGGQSEASCAPIEPRDAQFFESLAGTPAADETSGGQAGSAATPTPFAMPEGEAADEATLDEVTTLYEQLIACLNAGDYLRVYALYSDAYLERNYSDELLATLQATPVPTEEAMQSELGGILEARVLDDGRIATLLTTRNPQSGEVLIFATLSRDGERLRIDEEQIVEAETPPATPAGTPAA